MPIVNPTDAPVVELSVDSIAALRLLPGGIFKHVMVDGYLTAGDVPARIVRWNPTDARADNGGTIFAPTVGTGRWNDIDDILTAHKFGAVGDGATDDTAAIQRAINAAATRGGGTVLFPLGTYLVGGALQDGNRANAQILLPSISIFTPFQQLSIELRGESPPPASPGVNLGTTALPAGGTIIKSTLNAGAGGALIGCQGPVASASNFTNIQVKIKDILFRLPSNPVLSAVNLKWAAASELENVSVDSGSYDVPAIPLPTTATSYGIRTPGAANGAVNRLSNVTVTGFYNGIEVGEHLHSSGQLAFYGCLNAVTFAASSFPSHFDLLMLVHCQNGLVFTTTQYLEINLLSIEHAADATWMVPVWDISDAGNGANGSLVWGPSTATLLVTGGIGLKTTQVGSEMAAWAAHVPVVTSGTGAFTLVAGTTRWKRDGKQIFFSTKINITTNGTAGQTVAFTLPVVAQGTLIQIACGRASGVSGFMLQVQIVSTTATIRNYDNSYPGANGEQLNVSGVYEAA